MNDKIRLPNVALQRAFEEFMLTKASLCERETRLLDILKLLVLGLIHYGNVTPAHEKVNKLIFSFKKSEPTEIFDFLEIEYGYQQLMVYSVKGKQRDLIGGMPLHLFDAFGVVEVVSGLLSGKVLQAAR